MLKLTEIVTRYSIKISIVATQIVADRRAGEVDQDLTEADKPPANK